MKKITSFEGRYEFLSNFAVSPIFYEGEQYPTVEHAYQALKANKEEDRLAIQQLPTPGKAKRMGRKIEMRPDFEKIKLEVMKKCLREKFKEGSHLADKLLSTGDSLLVEGNDWGDKLWGMVIENKTYVGENLLGLMLMEIRFDLTKKS